MKFCTKQLGFDGFIALAQRHVSQPKQILVRVWDCLVLVAPKNLPSTDIGGIFGVEIFGALLTPVKYRVISDVMKPRNPEHI